MTKTLYINPLTSPISLTVLEWNHITHESSLPRNGDEFSTFPEMIVDLVDRYSVEEIWCITWPGPFTLMRIITLTINTLQIVQWVWLKGIHFFDLIDMSLYTPLLEINSHEYLIRWSTWDTLVAQWDLPYGQYMWICSDIAFTDDKKIIQYTPDIAKIIAIFESKTQENRISPIYFKPPHITWSKKSISHSSKTLNI
jgi:hypothetical protein